MSSGTTTQSPTYPVNNLRKLNPEYVVILAKSKCLHSLVNQVDRKSVV